MDNVAANQGSDEQIETEEDRIKTFANQIQETLHSYDYRETPKNHLITRVPEKLHAICEAAYRPRCSYIGLLRGSQAHDYHHWSEYFQDWLDNMRYKTTFVRSFLKRVEKNATLEDFIRLIEDSRGKIYRSYDLGCVRDSSMTLIILTDATFIIELLLTAYYKKDIDNVIFATAGFMNDIQRDLILWENQLPFFVLTDVYELAFPDHEEIPSFLHLTCQFFSHYYNRNIPIQDVLPRSKLEGVKHLTDLMRTLQLPHSFQMHCNNNEESLCFKWIQTKVQHLMGLIRSSLQLSSQNLRENEPEESLEEGKVRGEYLYSAVLLREAGVKFKVSPNRCLLDIEFNEKNGEFRIPPLRLDEFTESFFRNLMAWEQYYYYPDETYICNYVFLMEYLIKSVEDVDLLVRRRILINQLGSHEAVVKLFNELCKHVKVEKNHYSGHFSKLNAYNAVRHHSWIAILKLQYFSTLWRGVATIAAVILLVLTLIQTICSVISVSP